MFDFIEATASEVSIEFDPVFGWPRLISLDNERGFSGIFVQDVRPGLPAGPAEIRAELAFQTGVWRGAAADDCTITLRRSCFCAPPFNDPYAVTVRAGEVVAVERNGAPVDLEAFLPATVEDLFAAIATLVFADRLDVQYHSDLGYPVAIDADPAFNAADEEFSIVVEDLVVD
jgi:hypothetical protein